MQKEELFEKIIGQECIFHYTVEGCSEEFRTMTVSEIDNNGQIVGTDNEGMFYFNWSGASISEIDEDIYEVSKGAVLLEISLNKGGN